MDLHEAGPALMAEFASMEAVVSAARGLGELGYRNLEIFSPYPVSGADDLLSLRRPRLPRAVLAVGLAGALLALAVQWFTNAWDYPLNVGGRPLLAVPAWIPITFETMVLAAAVAAVIGLLAATGLPRYWHPVFEVEGFERASDDRFWIAIGRADPRLDPARSRAELERLGALRVIIPEVGG